MFKQYNFKLVSTLSKGKKETNWKKILENHKLMISRIQHERLIHLLVTIFVGTVMSLTFLVVITTKTAILLFIGVPLLLLFIGYLVHYRFLENTTQSWYKIEDKIKNKLHNDNQ